MTALATQTSSKRRLLLASDSNDNAAWALGATDTISRPFDREGILQRIRSAFPDTVSFDATGSGKALNKGIPAVQAVTVKMYEKLPAGTPLSFGDILEAENKILRAIKQTSARMAKYFWPASHRSSTFISTKRAMSPSAV
jgi:hypothetical protein